MCSSVSVPVGRRRGGSEATSADAADTPGQEPVQDGAVRSVAPHYRTILHFIYAIITFGGSGACRRNQFYL